MAPAQEVDYHLVVGFGEKALAVLVALVGAVVTHTFYFARWGGKVTTLLKGHERRLERLENIQDRRLT